MSINAIREALAAACDGIADLRAVPLVPDAVNTNQAVVVRQDIEYDLVFDGAKQTYQFKIVVYANRTPERASQLFLDNLCEPNGATSIKTVVEAAMDSTTVSDYADVKKASGVGSVTVGAIEYLTVEFDLEVVAP